MENSNKENTNQIKNKFDQTRLLDNHFDPSIHNYAWKAPGKHPN